MVYVVIGVILVIFIYVLIEYNSFARINYKVKEAFSTMDIYLKKRWDLVPNLVEIVKAYAKHESTTFEEVTKLRRNGYDNLSLRDKINANIKLYDEISKILMVSENYPELKANEGFLDLAQKLTKVEDEIANSRKYYNAVVKKLNTKIEMFPSNIIASIFKFKQADMFSIDENERKNISVS